MKEWTPKELVLRALAGEPIAHFPVMTPYVMLSNADHWCEVTGEPVWKYYELRLKSPEEQEPYLKLFTERMPFDLLQPLDAESPERRKHIYVEESGGEAFYVDKRDGSRSPVPKKIHESGSGGGEVEIRTVFTREEVRGKYALVPAQRLIDDGINAYHDSLAALFGKTHFLQSSCVINTFYSCSWSVGLTNLYTMLYDEPDFIHYLSEHILAQNIEYIRAYAKSGIDCIYIDDACSTMDMLSREMYQEFAWPYMKKQVEEIKRLGKKAMVIYFGGIDDRADLVAGLGADLVLMETAMKRYQNDYDAVAKAFSGKSALAANLNPYLDIEAASDGFLQKRLAEFTEKGRRYRKYITSTGSPLTPNTPVSRIKNYIDWAHQSWCKGATIWTVKNSGAFFPLEPTFAGRRCPP